jgi:hypothetical protein
MYGLYSWFPRVERMILISWNFFYMQGIQLFIFTWTTHNYSIKFYQWFLNQSLSINYSGL